MLDFHNSAKVTPTDLQPSMEYANQNLTDGMPKVLSVAVPVTKHHKHHKHHKHGGLKRQTLTDADDFIDKASGHNNRTQTTNQNSHARHILLVTETWLPDVNGVAMSLNQLMMAIADMGHRISLIRPKPIVTQATQTAMPALPNEPADINGTSYKNSLSKIDDILSDKKSSNTNNNTHAMTPLAYELHIKGMAIPKYANLQLGLPQYFVIKRFIKQVKPDVVHIATEGPLGLAALCAAKALGVPATTGYHTQFHDFSKHFGLGLLAMPMMAYFKRFHNWSAATCVPSQKTENDLSNLGFKRLYQVGRGVATDLYHPKQRSDELRASWQVGEQHTVLMMVSRLSPEKGGDVVISAFKRLQTEQLHREFKLVIVGDGPDRERLTQLAHGNEDIIFAGMQKGQSLAAHYASADVFVFASQVETFGNVVTEAMASGLPVYAFDDAAAGMLVDGACGALADMGDVAGFEQMVVDMPKLQQLKTMSHHARQKVKSLSWQRPAEQMLAMFDDVLMVNTQTKTE